MIVKPDDKWQDAFTVTSPPKATGKAGGKEAIRRAPGVSGELTRSVACGAVYKCELGRLDGRKVNLIVTGVLCNVFNDKGCGSHA